MKEETREWVLVRLLYKNRIILAISSTKEEFEDRFDKDRSKVAAKKFMKSSEGVPENEHDELMRSIVDEVAEDFVSMKHRYLEEDFFKYHKEAQVKRSDLEELYLSKRVSETNVFSLETEEKKNELRILRIEFNSILESCIESGCIKKDEDKKIYLTDLGKKFAGIGGLLRAYGREISDFIKDWRLVVGTMILFAGAVKWEWFLAKALMLLK